DKEDNTFILYVDVPEDETGNVTISIYDPNTGGKKDLIVGEADTVTEFAVYGDKLLDSKEFGEFGYDREYYQFGPYNKTDGQKIGQTYRFRLEAKTLKGDDENLFSVRISPDTAEAFSFCIPLRLVSKEGDKMFLYPQIPAGVREIIAENYDLDIDGGTCSLYDPEGAKDYIVKGSLTSERSETAIPVKVSNEPRRAVYIITKGTQRNANAVFQVKDDMGGMLPVYFKPGKTKIVITREEPKPKEEIACNKFTFDASSSYDPGNKKLSFLWDLGDGTTSESPIVTHVYEKAGEYKVSLRVKNDSGLGCDTAFTTETVKVNITPKVIFSAPDVVCVGKEVILDASGTIDNTPEALSYKWDLGDGTKAEGVRVTKIYERGGTYKIKLEADDNSGTPCSKGSFSKSIKVNAPPIADAGGDIRLFLDANQEYKVSFDGSKSSDPDGDRLEYRWDFGDGTTASGSKVTHIYKRGGFYTARLTVEDGSGSGCSQSVDILDVKLNKSPIADAGPNLVCCVDAENIFDGSRSNDPDGDNLEYSWNFGDGISAEGARAMHIYTKPGAYNVTLTVKDSYGAISVDSFMATVNTKPVPLIKVR
ncbi:MAG: PKD domain-containing protein, partial [Candidatus Omnitrophica bacterium]|nr:PKD domain-containing protein [Candidatus Omnitrophota bacterium]